MIVRDSRFARSRFAHFGTDWSSPSLWQNQADPKPSPLVETQTVYPANYVELPKTVPIDEAQTEDYSSPSTSGGGWFDSILGLAKGLFTQPAQGGNAYVPTQPAPSEPSFFSTPGGIAVAITGGVAVLGMTYFLFKPPSAPVAIYSGYRRSKRRRRKARRSR